VSPEAAEAARVVDAFHAALSKNDANAALALLADDVLIFEGGYVERSKAEYASHHLGADAAFASAVPSTLMRRSGAANGDAAWIASESRTTGHYKDKAVDRLSTESMVLKKDAAGWRIVHIHWSSRSAT
jgi:ketosteroid isomerase-like protein